ncbi:YfjI family protein [Bythopirellula goksoeyrii]|uniref:DUF3987 domain-containing protein n=1 Tax=Bythopirellula goksoeyrii TaxID=1400387 RepID=A0A5B9QAF5_9BACT|nr:YfjI family protein [Bythopirellula goksoeyrii]QEG34442.1 hypothetical protein Pr1d_17210 [Bythopirellula goksoeyrii]
MDVVALLEKARADGIQIEVVDGELLIEATRDKKHWLEKLRPHKQEILANLEGVDVDANSENVEEDHSCVSVNAYRTFPIHCLQGVVGEFVAAAAKAIGCDAAFIALPMLCCLARAVGNSRVIRLKATWVEPAILWAAIVGKSGSYKTPALQAVMKFLEKPQARAIAEHKDALQQHEEDKAVWERAYATWKQDKKTTEPPPSAPPEPVLKRFATSDCTIEALATLLAGQFDGVLVQRDELAGWLNGIAEYKGGKGSDLGHWLACHSGASLTVDRKTGAIKFIFVPRAAVSLLGGIQPGILRSAIAREHMQDGLCARMLFAMPDPRKVVWSDAVIDPRTEAAMTELFDTLFTLEPQVNDEGESEPLPMDLTPEAKATWVEYFNRHRAELVDLDDDLAAAWSKLEAYTARFALIFQLCSWAEEEAKSDIIDEVAMSAAIELSDWFGHEAKRVYGLFVEDQGDRERRELVELIRRKGGSVTPRDLMRCCRRFKTSKEAEVALQELVEAGLGSWEFDDHGGGRGQPTRRFTLVDSVDSDTNAVNPEEKPITVSVNGVNGSPKHLNGQSPGGAI